MKYTRAKTDDKNLTFRLFCRFLCIYTAGMPIASLILRVLPFLRTFGLAVEKAELLFFLLALLASFLTVAIPFLVAVTAAKSFYDLLLVQHLIKLTKCGQRSLLSFNAVLFLLIAAALLFFITAARAVRFSFYTEKQNLSLLLSRRFWRYFTECIICTAVAAVQSLLLSILC